MLVPGPLYHNGPAVWSCQALLQGNHVVVLARFDAEPGTAVPDVERTLDRFAEVAVPATGPCTDVGTLGFDAGAAEMDLLHDLGVWVSELWAQRNQCGVVHRRVRIDRQPVRCGPRPRPGGRVDVRLRVDAEVILGLPDEFNVGPLQLQDSAPITVGPQLGY